MMRMCVFRFIIIVLTFRWIRSRWHAQNGTKAARIALRQKFEAQGVNVFFIGESFGTSFSCQSKTELSQLFHREYLRSRWNCRSEHSIGQTQFTWCTSAHTLSLVFYPLIPLSDRRIVSRMEPWQSSERLHDSNCRTRETLRNDGDFGRTFRQDLQHRRKARRQQHQRLLAIEDCLLLDERSSQEENYLVCKGKHLGSLIFLFNHRWCLIERSLLVWTLPHRTLFQSRFRPFTSRSRICRKVARLHRR